MKMIVDELPEKSKDCIFAEYIDMTGKCICMFLSGMHLHSRCKLETGEECPYLATANNCAYYRPIEKGENTNAEN